ncbi:MAG: polyamine ABC transporter permease, partial [Rhodobacter sp.]|nr:polyamine ABC transporter permease [Rhodobacter sp.]
FNAEPYFTFTPKMLAFDPTGYSLRWYDALLTLGHPAPETPRDSTWWSLVWERATWVQAAKNSFWVGFWATVLATTLGTIAALGLSRPEMPYRRLIMALLISPMIVPIIITAVGMSFFFAKACVAPDSALGAVFGVFLSEKGCLANSHLGVIVAHAVLGIPFVIITVTATLSGFDQSLIRAAQSLGANPRTTFFKVIMPLILPGIISGALFAFVTSFDEVVAVLFIAGPDQQTIPRQMFNG